MAYADRELVTRQNRDASKLDARIALQAELRGRLEHELGSRDAIDVIKDAGMFVARE